jgi:uncharacterized membrane protein
VDSKRDTVEVDRRVDVINSAWKHIKKLDQLGTHLRVLPQLVDRLYRRCGGAESCK